jgi:hypothetical protein
VVAGILVLTSAAAGAALAIAGAALSLLLTALTFNPWLLGNLAINAAIIAVALGWL